MGTRRSVTAAWAVLAGGVLLSGGVGEARADEPSAASVAAAAPRPFHEITRDVRRSLAAEAKARTPAQSEAAVGELCLLFEELRHDPRREDAPTLDHAFQQVRSRLVSARESWRTSLRRAGWSWRDLGGPGRLTTGRPADATPPTATPTASVVAASPELASEPAIPAAFAWAMETELESALALHQNLAGPAPLAPEGRGVGGERRAGLSAFGQPEIAPHPASGPLLPSGEKGSVAAALAKSAARTGGGAVDDYGPMLVDLITRTIDPMFWDVHGGPGTVHYYRPLRVLVIRATREVHEKVGGTVGAVRRAGP